MPVVAPQATCTVPDGMLAVEVASHRYMQAGTGAAARLLSELQREALGRDDIVAADDALVFDAQNVLELDATRRHKGGGGIGGRASEFGIEGGEEVLAQVAIGRGDGGDAGDAPLVDQAILQGAIDAFTAAASGRVRRRRSGGPPAVGV